MAGGNSWWRAWVAAAHDPKLQRLSPAVFKHWFNLMCLAATMDGTLPDTVAVRVWCNLRTNWQAQWLLATLHNATLLDLVDGVYVPHNWEGRQYVSDVSTERVRRRRKRAHETAGETFHETPPEQSRERKVEKKAASNGSKERGSYLPQDWQPDEQDLAYARARNLDGNQLAVEFRNYWHGESGQRARKRDWHAAWRTWVGRARQGRPKQPHQTEGFRW